MRFIVQKAVKDLSIEQTIKTYEEIWLSKTFKLEVFSYQKLMERTDHEEDVRMKLLYFCRYFCCCKY